MTTKIATRVKKEFSFEDELISEFAFRAQKAVQNGDEYIEAAPHIFDHFFPGGLGDAGYMTAYGIRVYPIGKADEIIEHERIPLHFRLHPELAPGGRKPEAYKDDDNYINGVDVKP